MKTVCGSPNPTSYPAATLTDATGGEALLRFQQAAKAHLEALLETGRPIPPLI